MTDNPDIPESKDTPPTAGPSHEAAGGTAKAEAVSQPEPDPKGPYNIAQVIGEAAERDPDQLAVLSPVPDCLGRDRITFGELDRDSGILAGKLRNDLGLDPGERVLVMLRPGPDFYVVAFALFKAGLVPVMVDPGMGLRRMLECLSEGKPSALIGIKRAHLLSLLFPGYFRRIKTRVTMGRRLFWGGATLSGLMADSTATPLEPEGTLGTDTAAVLFTSGATGPPKGVVYTHSMFGAQVRAIRDNFCHEPGGRELVTFPLFGLFTPALGLTSVIADMDPVRPGKADPNKIIETIRQERITSLFASPALLHRLSEHLLGSPGRLEGVKVVISAGAPAQPSLIAGISSMLDEGARLFTPYGATEAMPLTLVDQEGIAKARGMTEQGFGMCVGSPLPHCHIRVIGISEGPINSFSEKDVLPQGEVGELVACGPMVAENYFDLPEATALTMVLGPNGRPWRRMGDVGWRDIRGHLWFCGRKSQRVVTKNATLFTVPCESIFLNHPQVRRAALVGVGEKGSMLPVMVIEPMKRLSSAKWDTFVTELLALAKANPRTRQIKTFLQRQNFPLDIRHNAKISREKLASWARTELSMKDMAATEFYKN
ncbi:MAG: AMP-binding protein [Deltaproteobacteria bacterium]|jgi:acyl-CoA synthetase (AMP-forming)/AMP-acid ligase II|nr:AMP-binding protein [Deltaproteobacteria bacterium]